MTRSDKAKAMTRGLFGAVLVAVSAGWSDREAIHLKDGHQVTGEVIAEKPGALYIDPGFDVIKVPRDQVVSRGKPGEAVRSETAPARADESDPSGFFDTRP